MMIGKKLILLAVVISTAGLLAVGMTQNVLAKTGGTPHHMADSDGLNMKDSGTRNETASGLIDKAKAAISDVKAKISALFNSTSGTGNTTSNTTTENHFEKHANKILNVSEKHLQKAEDAYAKGKFGKAFGQSMASWRISNHVESFLDKLLTFVKSHS